MARRGGCATARSAHSCARLRRPARTHLISLELRRLLPSLLQLVLALLRGVPAAAVLLEGDHRRRHRRRVKGLAARHDDRDILRGRRREVLPRRDQRAVGREELLRVEHALVELHPLLDVREHLLDRVLRLRQVDHRRAAA
eukprot:838040-Prymnesium_polylepis.1